MNIKYSNYKQKNYCLIFSQLLDRSTSAYGASDPVDEVTDVRVHDGVKGMSAPLGPPSDHSQLDESSDQRKLHDLNLPVSNPMKQNISV